MLRWVLVTALSFGALLASAPASAQLSAEEEAKRDRALAEQPVPPPLAVPAPRRSHRSSEEVDLSGWTAAGVYVGLTLGFTLGGLLAAAGDGAGAQAGAILPLVLPIGLGVLFHHRAERQGWNPRLGAALAGWQPGLLTGGLIGASIAGASCRDARCARRLHPSMMAVGAVTLMGLFSRFRHRAGLGSAVFHGLVAAGLVGGLIASAFRPGFRPALHGAAGGAALGMFFAAGAPGFDW